MQKFALMAMVLMTAFVVAGCTGSTDSGVTTVDGLIGNAVDCHSHTHRSIDGGWTLEENMQWHGEAGFTGVFITEHVSLYNTLPWICYTPNMQRWNQQHPNGPFALPGCEITTFSYHILMLGIESWDMRVPVGWDNTADGPDNVPTIDNETMLEWITLAVEDCHEKGGVAILAHPVDYNTFTWSEWATTGIDGIEARNSCVGPSQNISDPGEPHYYEDWASNATEAGMMLVAGSDWHEEHETMRCYTSIPGVAKTYDEVLSCILNGQTAALPYP